MTAGTKHVPVAAVQEKPEEGGHGYDQREGDGEKVDGYKGCGGEGYESRVTQGAASDPEDRFEDDGDDDRPDTIQEAGYGRYA